MFSVGIVLFVYSSGNYAASIYLDSIYVTFLVYRLNLPVTIFEKTTSARQETLLRISSAVPCGMLLYLGHYWNEIITKLLVSLPSRIASFSPEEIVLVVASGFVFIVIILVNTFVIIKWIAGKEQEKTEAFKELCGRALIITFFLALGGMMIIQFLLLFATAISLLKILKVRKIERFQDILLFSLRTEERSFWSLFRKNIGNPNTTFFYSSLALSGIIISTNLVFVKLDSVSQILFLSLCALAGFLGYHGIRNEWHKAYYMVVASFPYVAAFVLALIFPLSLPFNSFLFDLTNNEKLPLSGDIRYALPLIVFTLIFGLLGQSAIGARAEELSSRKLRHSILVYLEGIIAFAAFAMVFEFFFMGSVSEGWFSRNISVGGQMMGGFPEGLKAVIMSVSGTILSLGAVFYSIAVYVELRRKHKFDGPVAIRNRVRSCIVLFTMFLIFSVSAYSLDKFLISSTRTDNFVAGNLVVSKDTDLSLPVPDTIGWMRITSKSLSSDVINADVFNEWGYKQKEFNITSEESSIYLNSLDKMNYRISFHLVDDKNGDGQSTISLHVERGKSENISGPLGMATIWNLIMLAPHVKRMFE